MQNQWPPEPTIANLDGAQAGSNRLSKFFKAISLPMWLGISLCVLNAILPPVSLLSGGLKAYIYGSPDGVTFWVVAVGVVATIIGVPLSLLAPKQTKLQRIVAMILCLMPMIVGMISFWLTVTLGGFTL